MLPSADEESAQRTATRLKELVEEEGMPHETSQVADVVTVSQGVITVRPDSEVTPGELIQKADKALYEAKAQGRNTIVAAGRPRHESGFFRGRV